ncbi:hypothetical protein ASPCADRAFT_134452 [Aspergillus carbonarius ITEM 5010]|uniref:Major facilitator superfamily (MFS) profile domain-containing protein n=1 Tax=Aspergillus carbonarius (strain ITEM 5010) TaxID=602072 RepID=A0A1R3RAE1_ASPC5|nr:hypothetical protein ASPCADRAFT_134452 [Aspergillus carbonarius ITEM 5010]
MRQKNPLASLTRDELFRDVELFAREKNLEHIVDELKRGALVAQDPKSFEELQELSEGEKELLRREKTPRWSQPFMMYFITIFCAGSAIVQGMVQTAVNGAQEFYFAEFNLTNTWQQGLLNAVIYPRRGHVLCNCNDLGLQLHCLLTWLPLRDAFSPQGAFGWYAAWNIFGWIFCYFCLPETKALPLEELDQVFSVPTTKHINHYAGMLPWYVKTYILRGDVPPQKQLYDYE